MRYFRKIIPFLLILALLPGLGARAVQQGVPRAVPIADAASLEGIVAADLPRRGEVRIGGRTLLRGEGVAREDLARLVYCPEAGESESFSYYPVYQGGEIGPLVTLALEAPENRAPIARTLRMETYRNLPAAGTAGGMDPDGDELRVRILSEPAFGVVELDEDSGRFVYTPYQNRTGTDRFTFAVEDSFGAVSAPAEGTVKVYKPKSTLEYADMRGRTAAYAAVRLAELGIYEGPKLGGVSYFEPDEYMTRGELISMAVALSGEETLPVVRTGFADDEAIPAWVRPFAAAAQRTGFVAGQTTPQGVILRAGAPVTRAEAAVILCAAAGLPDAAETGVLADEEAVPAWAGSAAVSAAELGLLETPEGRFDADGLLTRAEGAQAVYRTWLEMQKNTVRTGFFSWVL